MNFRTTSVFSILVILVIGGIGCRSTHIQPKQEFADTITHAGTITELSRGEFEGFFAVTNLTRYGDHGLGTFDGLDGEMIIYSGIVYRADVACALATAPVSNLTPYAVVTYFNADRMFDIANVSQKLFKRAMDMRRKYDRIPQAIEVDGVFKSLTIRSEPLQEKPWSTLDEALKKSSRQMVLTNTAGIMVGYFYPDDLNALHPAGYHFHFINSDRTLGGHVLDFTISQARIGVDSSAALQVFLPTNHTTVLTFPPK